MTARNHRLARRNAPAQHGGATIRHRLASVASLFEYLCDKNTVTHNPVKGVERPRTESSKGETPAIGDHQARKRLARPRPTPSRASAIARSCRRCCSTRFGARIRMGSSSEIEAAHVTKGGKRGLRIRVIEGQPTLFDRI